MHQTKIGFDFGDAPGSFKTSFFPDHSRHEGLLHRCRHRVLLLLPDRGGGGRGRRRVVRGRRGRHEIRLLYRDRER